MNARRCLALLVLGVLATASLLLAPMEVLMPPQLHMAPLAFRAMTLVQPLVLLVALTGLGCWLAPKVALDAPLLRALLERTAAAPVLRRQIGPSLIVGLAVAALLLGYGWLTADWLRQAPAAAQFDIPLAPKLLYGGVTEELITRWGLMSLFVWAGWRLGGGRRPVAPRWYLLGAGLAALLFAAGHLPMLYLLMPSPRAELVGAVLAGNALPGFAFGVLFWRRGLEAAMIAHATAHAVSTLALLLAAP